MLNTCLFETEVSGDADSSGVMCTRGYTLAVCFFDVALNPLAQLLAEPQTRTFVRVTIQFPTVANSHVSQRHHKKSLRAFYDAAMMKSSPLHVLGSVTPSASDCGIF